MLWDLYQGVRVIPSRGSPETGFWFDGAMTTPFEGTETTS